MRKICSLFLSALLLAAPLAQANECLEAAQDEMNALYRTGCGCEDGIYTAVSTSMLGWGVGLFAGIALLTGLVRQSTAHAHSQ